MKKTCSLLLALVFCLSLFSAVVSAAQLPFTDVEAGIYYYEPVAWAVEKEVTTGTSETTFSPNATCTRNQVVTFLWRAMGKPEPTSNNNPFVDVKEDDYFYKAVLWAVEKGITNGVDDTHFGPEASCTRAQVATFLWRTLGSQAPTSQNHPFNDIVKGQYYYDAVLWAVENKVTTGTSDNTFEPDSTCTRGQIVTFLYRALENLHKHKYTAKVTAPTCEEDGFTTYTCECGDSYKADETKALGHKWTDACDKDCDVCGTTRTPEHVYTDACDSTCNGCDATRSVPHAYDNDCDTACNICGATRTTEHTYTDDCDESCDSCGEARTVPHAFENGCDKECNGCGLTRETEHYYKNYGSSYGNCENCGNPYVNVSEITLDKIYVQVGHTFTATISASGGEGPYTVDWFYVKSTNPWTAVKLDGLTDESVVITATEDMFDTANGNAYVYCHVTDSEGHVTSPMDPAGIRYVGELTVSLEEEYIPTDAWDDPSYGPDSYGYAIMYINKTGGDGENYTYKWEWARDKDGYWTDITNGTETGYDEYVGKMNVNNGSIPLGFKKAGLDNPMYVRVTVTSGEQTVTSNVCKIYRKLGGSTGSCYEPASGKEQLTVYPKGGDGETYKYTWYMYNHTHEKTMNVGNSYVTKVDGANTATMTILEKDWYEDMTSGNWQFYCVIENDGVTETVWIDNIP